MTIIRFYWFVNYAISFSIHVFRNGDMILIGTVRVIHLFVESYISNDHFIPLRELLYKR